MSRKKPISSKSKRDHGSFIALPTAVIDSPAFKKLSHPAKALLIEIARQYRGDNNGRLLCSREYLEPRGWNSNDVITRAKNKLLDSGFIYETVKGQRPNKASWYAITWHMLDKLSGYDYGAEAGFLRSAYKENKSLIPSPGAKTVSIAPSPGVAKGFSAPSPGAIRGGFNDCSAPSPGHHLEVTISGCCEEDKAQGQQIGSRSRVEQQREQVVAELKASRRSSLRGLVLNYRPTIAPPFAHKPPKTAKPSSLAA
ncbi:MAG: hypothetical protein RL651_1210 [Pseudomonadota bacterium]|jgi:hypothetical protein